jgi:SNF2 family DNA or RNA helicase
MGPFGSWWISNVVRDGKPQETLWIGLEGMGREVEKLSSGSSPVSGKGWSYSFKVDQVEALVRALDRAGLLPLAMSLRAALLVDMIERGCDVQDDLAGAAGLDDLKLPASREAVDAVLRDAPAVLAPNVKLRDYQAIGVAFMRQNKYRAILGDEPGLGKTLQVLTALALAPDILPALVIAPTSVLGVWAREAGVFTPGLRVVTARPKDHRENVPDAVRRVLREPFDLLVIGWDSLRLVKTELVEAAEAHRWRTVVMDEAHSAKRAGAQRSQIADELARLAPGGVIAVTGTLVENNAAEAYSILNMTAPGAYGSRDDFTEKYAKGSARIVNVRDERTGVTRKRKIKRVAPVDLEGAKDGAQLKALLAELRVALRCDMIRRLLDEVFKQMPPLVQQSIPLALAPDEARKYAAVIEEIPEWLAKATRYDLTRATAAAMENAELRGGDIPFQLGLTRALLPNVPGLEDDDVDAYYEGREGLPPDLERSAIKEVAKHRLLVAFGGLRRFIGELKAPVVLNEAVDYLAAHESPLVIFAEHKPVIAFLAEQLRAKDYSVAVIDGSVPEPKRVQIVEDFQNGKYRVLIGSTALRQGVTLTAADTAIFAEQWWNPAWINQAEKRIHRADDRTLAKKTVFARHYYAENTIDEQIAELLRKKRQVVNAVIGGIEGSGDSFTAAGPLKGLLEAAMQYGAQMVPTAADVRKFRAGDYPRPKGLNAGKVEIVSAADAAADKPAGFLAGED